MKTTAFLVCSLMMVGGLLHISCSSTSGLSIQKTSSWMQSDSRNTEEAIKLKTGVISAEAPSCGYSVEREIADMLPLIFLEKGCMFVADDSAAQYIIDVHAIERDYHVGWKSKKSVIMEILVRPAEGSLAGSLRVETPLAAGRTIAQGSVGLSVSKNTEALLRSAVAKVAASIRTLNNGSENRMMLSLAGKKEIEQTENVHIENVHIENANVEENVNAGAF